MKTFTVTTKRLICTKHKIEAETAEQAEAIVHEYSLQKLDEKDFIDGNEISITIEADAKPVKH